MNDQGITILGEPFDQLVIHSVLPYSNLESGRVVQSGSLLAIRLGLGTLVDIVLIQLLAHDFALRAGFEPGKFWIAEGVTRRE